MHIFTYTQICDHVPMHMCIQPICECICVYSPGGMIEKHVSSKLNPYAYAYVYTAHSGRGYDKQTVVQNALHDEDMTVLRSRAKRIARLHTPTHIFTCTHLCVYVCIHSYAYLHIYTYKCTCMNTHMCTGHGQHVFTRTHSCVYVRKHT